MYRTEGGDARRTVPLGVQGGEEVVHPLAGHVAVDQSFREPLRGDGRMLQPGQPQRHGEGPGHGVGPDRHPGGDPPDLVAGSLDEKPIGREPPGHRRPGVRNLGLAVLAQYVERPHDGGTAAAGHRHLEPAAGERDTGVGCERRAARSHQLELRAGMGDTGGIDLEAQDLDVGAHVRQPGVQLQRRDTAGAVAEVHHERVGSPAEGGLACDPPIHAPQPVGAGRAARDLPDRSPRHPPMMPGATVEPAGAARRHRARARAVAPISWGA